jgi:16S rRNA (guanine966-N2)-methyltransferase
MSIIQGDLPGARVLDLFAGSGALGLEALSRGAQSATFVELASRSLAALRANIDALGAEAQSTVHRGDALAFAGKLTASTYDVAFADPPYRLELAERVAHLWLETPFARVLGIEHEKGCRLPHASDRREYGDTVVTFFRSG